MLTGAACPTSRFLWRRRRSTAAVTCGRATVYIEGLDRIYNAMGARGNGIRLF
jgi:hypothetical protein